MSRLLRNRTNQGNLTLLYRKKINVFFAFLTLANPRAKSKKVDFSYTMKKALDLYLKLLLYHHEKGTSIASRMKEIFHEAYLCTPKWKSPEQQQRKTAFIFCAFILRLLQQ